MGCLGDFEIDTETLLFKVGFTCISGMNLSDEINLAKFFKPDEQGKDLPIYKNGGKFGGKLIMDY